MLIGLAQPAQAPRCTETRAAAPWASAHLSFCFGRVAFTFARRVLALAELR